MRLWAILLLLAAFAPLALAGISSSLDWTRQPHGFNAQTRTAQASFCFHKDVQSWSAYLHDTDKGHNHRLIPHFTQLDDKCWRVGFRLPLNIAGHFQLVLQRRLLWIFPWTMLTSKPFAVRTPTEHTAKQNTAIDRLHQPDVHAPPVQRLIAAAPNAEPQRPATFLNHVKTFDEEVTKLRGLFDDFTRLTNAVAAFQQSKANK